jgi:phosphate transport system permease protein
MSLDMTQPMASIPMAIVRYSNTNYADWIALAWTGAMLITVGVLLLNILSRLSYAAIAGKQEG